MDDGYMELDAADGGDDGHPYDVTGADEPAERGTWLTAPLDDEQADNNRRMNGVVRECEG